MKSFFKRVAGGRQSPPTEMSGALKVDGPILEVTDLSKAFGGVQAVLDFSFELKRGMIKSIVGPNGSGKTTIFNLLCGIIRPDSGQVKFKGQDITGMSPHLICRAGLARTFQVVRPFGRLPVLENVMLGRERRFTMGLIDVALRTPKGRREERLARSRSFEYLDLVGLTAKAFEVPDNLTLGQHKMLEVARVLATEPELLLLDEPAGGLNDAEAAQLARLLRDLRSRGITILLVEHNMGLVMQLSDEVIFMDLGKKVAEGTPAEIQSNPEVIASYLGQE